MLFIPQLLLLGWFFGCIVGYKIGSVLLVEGMGIRSAEFFMLVLYTAALLLRLLLPGVGNGFALGVLVFWLVIQYFCHWHYTLFGATEKKLQGYNRCFQNTLHLFPLREDRIVPDLYHILLHVLLLLNTVLLLIELF